MKKIVSCAVIGALIIGIASLGYSVFSGGGGKSSAKTKVAQPRTVEQKLQSLINKGKTSAVASATVVKCQDAGAQTVENVAYAKVYACPVTVVMKTGATGCAGLVITITSNGSPALVTAPTAIDPKYCA